VLGTARDADVLLDVLASGAATLQERDEPVAARLIDRLRRQRAGYQDALLAAMRSRRYLTLLDDLVMAARTPAVLPEVAASPARSLGELMERPWKHLEHAASAAGTFPADAALHEIRIRAKRARYAAEALIPAFGKPARRFGEAAAELQTVLGRHQDAVIASAWLRDEAGHAAAEIATSPTPHVESALVRAGVDPARAAQVAPYVAYRVLLLLSPAPPAPPPGVTGWQPGPPSDVGPGPQAEPHTDPSCGCIGDDNQYLGFVGDAQEESSLLPNLQ